MINFDSVWIDMDGTLMDWAKGNKRKALISMSDPDYYLSLRPTSEKLYYYLSGLKLHGKSLHIISGIPDFLNSYYIPIVNYEDYYDLVCRAKDYTIEKYFKGLFDTVDYTIQSESKTYYIKNKYNPTSPVFIDDMDRYIEEWKSGMNQYAFKVDEDFTCEDCLELLLQYA